MTPTDSPRFAALAPIVQAWASELATACERWPDWRVAPADLLVLMGGEWEALREAGVDAVVPHLTEPEIVWGTEAVNAWLAWDRRHPETAPAPVHRVSVSRALPQVTVHVEAVRAAMRDGRVHASTWAAQAGLSHRVVSAWLAGDSIDDTWGGYAWAAAVTTTVPGWPSPRAAITPVEEAPDARGEP